jgi:hypothetical protein
LERKRKRKEKEIDHLARLAQAVHVLVGAEVAAVPLHREAVVVHKRSANGHRLHKLLSLPAQSRPSAVAKSLARGKERRASV